MSRLNKRQQRELEKLAALGGDNKSNEEDEDEAFEQTKAPSGFAALMNQDVEDDEDEDETPAKSSKSKKSKKKKKESGISTPVTLQIPPVPGPSKKDKKALKKQKAKEKKDDPLDIDKALAELSMKYPDLKPVSNAATNTSTDTSRQLSALLSVAVQNLDSEVEMRKFFGSKVIAASKSGTSGSSGPSRRQNVVQRSTLTRPKPTWWPAQLREGLSIRQLSVEESADTIFRHGWEPFNENWWTVEYSKKYRGVTLAFMQTVMSGDPDGFNNLLRALPYHADTLLQLSEVYNHREEFSSAAEFVDRALFAYERAFVGSFNFTNGINRLDFDRVENRPFFLALHRQIADLQRRGCNRTAFEFSKLLYSLDPWSDPHGALLHLDSLAIKGSMHDWLLDLWDFFQRHSKDLESRLNVMALPGWWYARALALRIKGSDQSTKALKDAIERFPAVLPLLADKVDLSLPEEIRSHQKFRIHTDALSLSTQTQAIVQLLCHLYVQRSHPLWKKAEHVKWLAETVKSLNPSFPTPPTPETDHLLSLPLIQSSIYRHVLVLEQSCRRLFPFLPKEVTNSRQVACDPLPPASKISEYDTEFFRGTEDVLSYNPRRRNRRDEQRMLERLVPDPIFRRQLLAFFEAHPQFAARFPGGIIQFAQIAANLPEDALEDMMIAEADNMQEPNRELPGQMPGHPVFDFDDPPALEEQVGDEDDGSEGEDLFVRPLVRSSRGASSPGLAGN